MLVKVAEGLVWNFKKECGPSLFHVQFSKDQKVCLQSNTLKQPMTLLSASLWGAAFIWQQADRSVWSRVLGLCSSYLPSIPMFSFNLSVFLLFFENLRCKDHLYWTGRLRMDSWAELHQQSCYTLRNPATAGEISLSSLLQGRSVWGDPE